MKKTKFAELLGMNASDLRSELKSARKDLMVARLSKSDLDASPNPHARSNLIRGLKKRIARVMTALTALRKGLVVAEGKKQ